MPNNIDRALFKVITLTAYLWLAFAFMLAGRFAFELMLPVLAEWLAFAIAFAAALAIALACVWMLFAAEFIAFAAFAIALATALLALALAFDVSPPHAIPSAVRVNRPVSARTFFILKFSPVFLKDL